MERRETHFAGHVQGVGFRWMVQRLVSGTSITGYVRNLANGEVQLVVEGQTAEIDALHAAIQREKGGNIRDTRSVSLPAEGVFTSFEIRR